MIGGQTKTPTLSVLYNGEEKYIGGAGIVAKHLKEAGGDVTFTSVVGDDELGHYAYNELKKNIKVNFILINLDLQPIKMCLFLEIIDY